ncbi:hypothetical protein KIW84_045144 [Lathyrus oleraceus]|uniref:Uncharacterized protein n=1 Tax=Pisum sativum TaxID=3888 RepID=A0A9D4XHT6_PEA|nr:hypothetical protein KIW84_045144 [Pisum sativum]
MTCNILSSECLLLTINIGIQRSRDRLELGLLDCEKINGISNFDLPLILVVTIVDQNLTRFLVDDRSSCNILYAGTLKRLGIQQVDLNLFNGEDLLAFNDLLTHPYGMIVIMLEIRKGMCERKVSYHDKEGKLTTVSTDLEEEEWIKELTLEDILALVGGTKEGSRDTNTFNLDAREVEVWPIPNGEFKSI